MQFFLFLGLNKINMQKKRIAITILSNMKNSLGFFPVFIKANTSFEIYFLLKHTYVTILFLSIHISIVSNKSSFRLPI